MQILPEANTKSNKMLIALLAVLFLVIAAFGGMAIYQNYTTNDNTAKPTVTITTTPTTSSSDLSDSASKPVSTNVNDEVNYLDKALGAQTDEDYTDSNLSNTELGIN